MENNQSVTLPLPTLSIMQGTVSHNLNALLEAIKKHTEEYKHLVYGDNSVATAKRDRANLNSLAKTVNEARLNAEKDFMKPFYEVKDICKEIDAEIKSASVVADTFIKNAEKVMRDERKRECELIFANEEFNLIDFEQIFNEKWLNKSVSLAEVKKNIKDLIEDIKKDIEIVENFPNSVENNLKAYYLNTLDANKTLAYSISLTERKERLRLEKEETDLKFEKEAEKNTTLMNTSKMAVNLDLPETETVTEAEREVGALDEISFLVNIDFHITNTDYRKLMIFLKMNNISFNINK